MVWVSRRHCCFHHLCYCQIDSLSLSNIIMPPAAGTNGCSVFSCLQLNPPLFKPKGEIDFSLYSSMCLNYSWQFSLQMVIWLIFALKTGMVCAAILHHYDLLFLWKFCSLHLCYCNMESGISPYMPWCYRTPAVTLWCHPIHRTHRNRRCDFKNNVSQSLPPALQLSVPGGCRN